MDETTKRIEPIDARRAADGKWREKMRHNVREEIDVALGYAGSFGRAGVDSLLLKLVASTTLIKAIEDHDLERDGDFLEYVKPLVENAIRTWLRGPENQQGSTPIRIPSLRLAASKESRTMIDLHPPPGSRNPANPTAHCLTA